MIETIQLHLVEETPNGKWMLYAGETFVSPQPSQVKVEYEGGLKVTTLVFKDNKDYKSAFCTKPRQPYVLKEEVPKDFEEDKVYV